MNDKPPSAYKMEQAFSALMSARARIAENDGEYIDDLTGEVLDVSHIENDALALLDATLRAAQAAKVMADAATARAQEVGARAARFKVRCDALRGAAFAAMDVLDMQKRELPDLTASIRKGQPQVVITDESALPPVYMRHPPPAPDKVALKAALQNGAEIPGATLSNSLPSLTIRTN